MFLIDGHYSFTVYLLTGEAYECPVSFHTFAGADNAAHKYCDELPWDSLPVRVRITPVLIEAETRAIIVRRTLPAAVSA